MHWLDSIDVGLLRLINGTLSNSAFDVLMPMASGQGTKGLFLVLAIVGGLLLMWKGGKRGCVCVLMLALVIPTNDGLLCNTVKHAVARPRPFVVLPDVRRPGSRPNPAPLSMPATVPETGGSKPPSTGGNNSMPSSHAANWSAATMVLLVYYRRSWKFTLPLALLVSYSRIYNGVHYPSDVLAGALLGAGYAVGVMWALNSLWRWAGSRWFPGAWKTMPALVDPDFALPADRPETRTAKPPPEATPSLH